MDITVVVDRIEKETPDAILVNQSGLKVWLPRSQIPYMSKQVQGEKPCVILTMPDWLAKKKELDYE